MESKEDAKERAECPLCTKTFKSRKLHQASIVLTIFSGMSNIVIVFVVPMEETVKFIQILMLHESFTSSFQ